ncbi:unnamed protein product [Sphagnum jensenii]|uniref:Uncharacterized protein n=1 Tax=Sphagnum jensenii TaxID=128206 RepID=A0ABP0XJG4_9BRYO
MGQTLRKLAPIARKTPQKPQQRQQQQQTAPAAARVRQSVEIIPQAPEPQMIIEPAQNTRDGLELDPKYASMMQQVVGRISTRPGGTQEMGPAHEAAEYRRPKPTNRHTSALTGPDEERVVAPGTLNLAQIHELFHLYQQAQVEGQQEKPVDTQFLAKKFNVDVVLLEKVLQFSSLPDKPKQDAGNQRIDPSQQKSGGLET